MAVWRSPEDLVSIGFQRSSVVMMNEAHNDLQRCVRTREIGRRILPAAHQAGVRHLAMEALWPYSLAEEANRVRQMPEPTEEGYLAQPEMRRFIQAALDLGWTLVPYEANNEVHPAERERTESINWEEEKETPILSDVAVKRVNWREEQQARNLSQAHEAMPTGTKLLVWCGNSHHGKENHDWFSPMGYRFRELSGINHFGIDQCVTVDFFSSTGKQAGTGLAGQFAAELAAHGGTAGFLSEDAPVSFLRDRGDQDAFILSTENELD